MTTSPRDALDRLVAALEAHYDAVTRRTGEADPAVISAYQTLADAFETYDNALYDTFDEVTPFDLVDDADDDLDDDELDDDELDDEELDDEELDDLDDLEDELDDDELADDVIDDDTVEDDVIEAHVIEEDVDDHGRQAPAGESQNRSG